MAPQQWSLPAAPGIAPRGCQAIFALALALSPSNLPLAQSSLCCTQVTVIPEKNGRVAKLPQLLPWPLRVLQQTRCKPTSPQQRCSATTASRVFVCIPLRSLLHCPVVIAVWPSCGWLLLSDALTERSSNNLLHACTRARMAGNAEIQNQV